MSDSSTVDGGVPWWPDAIASHADSPERARESWGYVVIEEVAGAVAELIRWPWPLADQLGHLVWTVEDQDAAVTATVPVPVLREQMYGPSGLQRSPRAGDTFAVELGGSGWSAPDVGGQPVADLRLVLPGTVLDISADARDAAKLAYQGANAAVFDGADSAELLEQAARDRQRRTPGPAALTITSARDPDGAPGGAGGGS